MKSLTLLNKVNELDHYIFIIHTRIGKYPGLYLDLYS
jgi:hypothetical protein